MINVRSNIYTFLLNTYFSSSLQEGIPQKNIVHQSVRDVNILYAFTLAYSGQRRH